MNPTEIADIHVGQQLPSTTVTLRRVDLMRYCGACGDFTGTHWNERIARSVGLPDVISHGTLNAAVAVRMVSDWYGDPAAVTGYHVDRFSHPVVVPDDDIGATLSLSATVESRTTDGLLTIRVRARTHDGKQVMGGVRVYLRQHPPEERHGHD